MGNLLCWPILLVRWVVLATCVCALAVHLLIDSLGLPLSLGSAGPVVARAAFTGLAQGDAHHDHFYLPGWQPARQPVSRVAIPAIQAVIHCLRSSSPLLPPPKAITAA